MVLIKNGIVYTTAAGAKANPTTTDLLIEDGIITRIAENIPATSDMDVLDATGLIVAPGLVDLHVHLRDPGYEYKEDILTGAATAAAGGVTTCCCMPNTSPVADNAETIRYITEKSKQATVRVLPYGAVTIGQKGIELTDFEALKNEGIIGLSDDGNTIQDEHIMREAMRQATALGLLISSHCEDTDMVKNYAVNEGRISRKLGIPGRPALAEEMMIERDAKLAAETGARIHIAHVSTAGSVEIIRKAKAAGIRITAETCPQYFALTEDEILRQGALARVNPPLRTQNDVEAIISGLIDGTIDCIATDHAPHSTEEKKRPLEDAPSGMIGLETMLALALTHLYHTGKLGIGEIIAMTSSNPAHILGLYAGEFAIGELAVEELAIGALAVEELAIGALAIGELAIGALAVEELAIGALAIGELAIGKIAIGKIADIAIFDPNEKWTVDPAKFKSKARNTPFAGMELRGKVKYTISRGKIVYKD